MIIDTSILVEKLLRIALVIIGASFLKRAVTKITDRSLKKVNHGISGEAKQARVKTLDSVVSNLASFIIGITAIMIVLSEVGVDIAPLLTGAGILGLGIGFASQSLVKDYISGFFILFENQFNVGDRLEVAGKKGTVKELSLRTTTLKDEEGNLHLIPNSKIDIVTKQC
jgi:small-conductance mechanosensitive channel